mmetsp:Transcript_8912/g.28010  ORF Transcript_8912/g.28010 Transcript_8912/m.28010 type:complete len:205 (-) Transcript_8912:130-744(-)
MPASQCFCAAGMSSHCGIACLPATIALIRWSEARQPCATSSRQLASAGRKMLATEPFLLARLSSAPGAWCVYPLWSCRHVCDVSRMLSEAHGARHRTSLVALSHLACWLIMESTVWQKASYVAKRPCRPVSVYPSSQPSQQCSDSTSITRPSALAASSPGRESHVAMRPVTSKTAASLFDVISSGQTTRKLAAASFSLNTSRRY